MTCSIIQKSQLEGAHRLDAEYFQPKYLKIDQEIRNSNYKTWEEIEGRFITGPFGSEFNVDNYVLDGKFRYVRGKDVKEFFLLDDDNVYIPQKDFDRLQKCSLVKGDILISVVGTLGNAVVVDNSVLPAIFSCKSTVFRSKSIDPYYLIAYLNSHYGRNLLIRNVRGAVQTGLNIGDLKFLPIIIPSINKQKAIASIVVAAKKISDDSKFLYSQAEDLLLEELGLKDFKPEEDLSCVVNLSDAKSVHRMDAEFFQPKYERIIQKINKHKVTLLGDLAIMKKGIEPGSDEYLNEGKLFIRVSSISMQGIIDRDQKYLSNELYQTFRTNFEPKVGEILLTKDATPGIAYVIKESVEGIISSGIMRLKLKEDIGTEYLALCINSIVGRMQMERDAGGSIIIHWKPEQIKNLQIPILPKFTQQKIADLVRKSHEARKKAKELLDEAKQKVERIISGE
ncbi:MAG: restriction endonuclease subunit S [Candidatus Omnitrophota bacterium]